MSENKKDLYPDLGLDDIIGILQTKEIQNFFNLTILYLNLVSLVVFLK